MVNIKILVAHHKPGKVIESEMYLPIHVGKALSDRNLNMQGDDTGDNISIYNPTFCEMTAVYWGWKNIDADYIGLCHYRRFFTFQHNSMWVRVKNKLKYVFFSSIGNVLRHGVDFAYTGQISSDAQLFEQNAFLFERTIHECLDSHRFDMIVPIPYHFACRDNESFFSVIGRDHIVILKELVNEKYPKYSKLLAETLRSNTLYAANMFIFSRVLFHEYCNFIFPILMDHLDMVKSREWCIDPLHEKCYARISGYLAELLTSTFILKMLKEKKKVKFVNTLFLNA